MFAIYFWQFTKKLEELYKKIFCYNKVKIKFVDSEQTYHNLTKISQATVIILL